MAKRFLALDSCRGLCAVVVMLFHMDAKTHFYELSTVRNGWVAVDFFFVLSGFVIASAYSKRLQTFYDASRFAVRRFGRLYPLHIAVLFVYLIIELARLLVLHADDAFTNNASIPAFFEQLVLVQGFTTNNQSWNYPAWSISVELWTNFAFAFLALVFARRLPVCVLILTAVTGALVVFGDRLALPLSSAELGALLDAARSVFGFFLGFLAFAVFDAARMRGWKPYRGTELLAVLLTAYVFTSADELPAVVPPLIFFGVVLAFAFETGPISKLLQHPACIRLGTTSYSIYLTHSLYLLAMENGVYALAQHLNLPPTVTVNGDDLLALGGPWAMDAAGLLCIAVALYGSSLTYQHIEEPARLFFNQLSRRISERGAQPDAAASSLRELSEAS